MEAWEKTQIVEAPDRFESRYGHQTPANMAANELPSYCGHRAEKYQIAHHMDEDPENNFEENLSVICQMCNVIMHAGQGCVVQGVVDLYKESNYS